MASRIYLLASAQCFLPPTNFLKARPKGYVRSMAIPPNHDGTPNNPTLIRSSNNYKPSTRGHDLSTDSLKINLTARSKQLEEDVRNLMINVSENMDSLQVLQLIDEIQRFGLEYRFDSDIKLALDRTVLVKSDKTRAETTLYATALRFRILRQHGYDVSQEVFRVFLDDQTGTFEPSLGNDVKGMLSLHEASSLAIEGEDLMDEAEAFTTRNLMRNIGGKIGKSDEESMIHRALELPRHRRVQILETRMNIEESHKSRGESYTDSRIVELATLDFTLLQMAVQRDLHDISGCLKDMGLGSKLSFSQKLVESIFCSAAMVSDPQLGEYRKGLAKIAIFITITDDIYDIYGSLDELELFTDAITKWDLDLIRNLPDYMQQCCLALYNTVNEMAYDIQKEQGVNIAPYLKKAWADLCQAFMVEAKWRYNKYTPGFEEYLENGWRSVSGVVILIHSYFLAKENITEEALGSLKSNDDILRWPSIIFRLRNDLAVSSAELNKGVNSVVSYMQDNGASEESSRVKIREIVDKSWKKMNKYLANDSVFSKCFVKTTMDLARIAECTYQYGDGYRSPDNRAKKRVMSLMIEPITRRS